MLRAHERWGTDALERLRGMFAYALWDEQAGELFCARDRFGIKPFYYAVVGDVFYFASEVKALLPFLPAVETDLEGLRDYLAFQFCLAGKTLFKGMRELPPGHFLSAARRRSSSRGATGRSSTRSTSSHDEAYFAERIAELLDESVELHMRSDVPVSRLSLAAAWTPARSPGWRRTTQPRAAAFTGKFSEDPRYDESAYARDRRRRSAGLELHEIDIGVEDFLENDRGRRLPHGLPGGRPRLVPPVHGLAGRGRAGQGDPRRPGRRRDLRRLHPLPGRLLRAVHQGRRSTAPLHSGNFVVTYESIIPNLVALRNYKPMLREFWKDGLFGELDARYFRLINRAHARRERGRHRRRSATTRRSRPSARSSTAATSATRPTSTR